MKNSQSYLSSSIGRKQIVAVTGLMLVGFIVAHLAGNMTMFAGPEWFNSYAEHLGALRPFLNVAEAFLIFVFFAHVWFTFTLVQENIQARKQQYTGLKVKKPWASRLMPLTGFILFSFIVWHLFDFTWTEHEGRRAMIEGHDYGLFGIVYNSFKNPLHSFAYVIAMCCVGFHLSHGIQSVIQSFGYNHPKYTPLLIKVSTWTGIVVAILFSSIPLSVLFNLISI